TGTGTISVFGRQIRHKMSEGFPLLTTKKMYFKGILTELLWFLNGDTNIKFLVENDCHIWDGDAYKNYIKMPKELSDVISDKDKFNGRNLTKEEFIERVKSDDEFAKSWGNLGPIYGKQWRRWSTYPNQYGEFEHNPIDQIANLINDLKTNPDSRRLMVNAWNVGELDQMILPPCHYGFQVYTRELSLEERKNIWLLKNSDKPHLLYHPGMVEKSHPLTTPQDWFDEQNIPNRAISLMWNQRSVDTFLGLPFNIASYGLLLEIIAKTVNMLPEELIGNLGDTHLYLNHIEQAKEQIGRDLNDEERYNIWFNNNYETGMEKYFDPQNLPDFDNTYYQPTPKSTREPYPLPKLNLGAGHPMEIVDWFKTPFNVLLDNLIHHKDACFVLENYKSHSTIKAPLSN
ncbi:thymidylate synthase, partial [bacterium]|nr:thymidylate synthase [Candidatus Elulimicrobium humile]